MRGMPEGLPPAREAFVQALRDMRGRRIPMRVIGEECDRATGTVQRYFVGVMLPDMETTRRITEVCGGDWKRMEALRRAVDRELDHATAQRRKRKSRPSLTRRVKTLEAELFMVKQVLTRLTTDKEGRMMSTPKGYILVYRTSDGEIKAHTTTFTDFNRAAVAAGRVLTDNGAAGSAAARLFADALARRPLGTVWGHGSGYDFRILRADYTVDGATITPGLRLCAYYDMLWGTIVPGQFFDTGDLAVGGTFFDHFYLFRPEDSEGDYCRKYNGERLATKKPAGMKD